MKKKIAYAMFTGCMIVAAFTFGRCTKGNSAAAKAVNEHNEVTGTTWSDMYIEQDAPEIIDWNSDGYELSMTLSDGSEIYAYKKENVDYPNDYLDLNEVNDWEVTESGLMLYTKSGDEYWFTRNAN